MGKGGMGKGSEGKERGKGKGRGREIEGGRESVQLEMGLEFRSVKRLSLIHI